MSLLQWQPRKEQHYYGCPIIQFSTTCPRDTSNSAIISDYQRPELCKDYVRNGLDSLGGLGFGLGSTGLLVEVDSEDTVMLYDKTGKIWRCRARAWLGMNGIPSNLHGKMDNCACDTGI